jgi:hypothetical protein
VTVDKGAVFILRTSSLKKKQPNKGNEPTTHACITSRMALYFEQFNKSVMV